MITVIIAVMVVALLSIMMATVSDVRYYEHTAVDTPVTNKDLGGTALAPFVVPPGMNYIIGMAPSYVADGAVVSVSGGKFSMAGDGVSKNRTPVEIPMGAFGATLATAHSTPSRAGYVPTNIPVNEGADIDTTAEMVGADTGTSVSQMELEFSSIPRPNFPAVMTYKTLEVIVSAVDTPTELELTGTAKKFKANVKDNFIRQLISAVISASSATGAQSSALKFSGTGIKQDQIWTLDGSGGTHATEANGHAEARVRNIMAAIDGNQPIKGECFMSGVDAGDVLFLIGIGTSP